VQPDAFRLRLEKRERDTSEDFRIQHKKSEAFEMYLASSFGECLCDQSRQTEEMEPVWAQRLKEQAVVFQSVMPDLSADHLSLKTSGGTANERSRPAYVESDGTLQEAGNYTAGDNTHNDRFEAATDPGDHGHTACNGQQDEQLKPCGNIFSSARSVYNRLRRLGSSSILREQRAKIAQSEVRRSRFKLQFSRIRNLANLSCLGTGSMRHERPQRFV